MLTVIGCGNPLRGDDGAGSAVAQRLRAACGGWTGVRVLDAGTDGMGVMFQARGARHLVVVDAARTGAEPGAVFRVPGSELEREFDPGASLHDFRWEHALYAGRRLFGAQFPREVTVFLVEAQCLDAGAPLSASVSLAVARVVAEIGSMMEAHGADPG